MCLGFIVRKGWVESESTLNQLCWISKSCISYLNRLCTFAYASNGEVAMKPTFVEIRIFSWFIQLNTVILLFADIDRGSFLLFKGLYDRLKTESFSSKPCLLPIIARDISTQ